jgi:hypothetical protein
MRIELTVSGTIEDRKAVEAAVDEDIDGFDTWFRNTVGDAPVTKLEKAIIKSYVYYKLYGDSNA